MRKKNLLLFSILILFIGLSLKKDGAQIGNQRAYYECKEPAKIDSSLFKVELGKTYFVFNTKLLPTNLKAKHFVWTEDNPKDHFTAYLINTSDSTFKADRQDGSLIMIQEAIDLKGQWKPIEYWVRSGCGNSNFNPLELDSGMYIMIPIKQYSGNYDTKMRLKMKVNNKLFYSEPFEGSMDKRQFEKQTNTVNGILYHGPASYLDN